MYTGGIGSYGLLVMVAAYLQAHPSQRPLSSRSRLTGPLEGSLGALLLDFFRLYGKSLHTEQVGVSCRCWTHAPYHVLSFPGFQPSPHSGCT